MHRIPRRPWRISFTAHQRANFTSAPEPPPEGPAPSFGNWGEVELPDASEVQRKRSSRELVTVLPSGYRPDLNYLRGGPAKTFAQQLARHRPQTSGSDEQSASPPPPNAFQLRRAEAAKAGDDETIARRKAARLAREANASSQTASSTRRQTSDKSTGNIESKRQVPGRGMRQNRQKLGRRRREPEAIDGRQALLREVEEMTFDTSLNDEILSQATSPMQSYRFSASQYLFSDLSDVFGGPAYSPLPPTTTFIPNNLTERYLKYSSQNSEVYVRDPVKLGAVELANLTLARAPDISLDKRQIAATIIKDAVNMVPPPIKRIRPKRMNVSDRRKLKK